MADEKKPAAKGGEGGELFHEKHYQEVWYLLIGLLLIGGIYIQLRTQFSQAANWYGLNTLWGVLVGWLRSLWSVWKVFGIIVTGISIVWGTYSFLKLREIRRQEKEIYGSDPSEEFGALAGVETQKQNGKWEKVLERLNSINPADWRLAIIEADVMLDELLRACGYKGEGVGEMLKSVEPSDMLTLDAAWEAHKVRNRIAHSGVDFELTEREAKRVVALFESVFKEFDII